MVRHGLRFLGCSLFVALLASCSPTTATPASGTTPDGGASDPSTDGSTTGPTLSCLEVLTCVGNCPESDAEACAQACVDQTRASSRDMTHALEQCLETSACADAACIETKCKSELDVCIADIADEGTPASGPTPTGTVPARLVGTWSSVGTSTGAVWTFEADGTTTTAFEIDTSLASCKYKTKLATSGVTTATADTYVYHRTSGTQELQNCSSTKKTPLAAAELTYHYELGTYDDGAAKLTIQIVNDDGTIDSHKTELHQ